jgi:RNA polymerase sigma-70 factor (ECF subfamily)
VTCCGLFLSVQLYGSPEMTASQSTSLSLVRRLKKRDQQAWSRLVRIYGPLVYRWCRRAGVPAQDAADVAQEVFQAVATGIDGFQRERDGDFFRGWLYGITRHKVNDYFRRRAGPVPAGGSSAQQRLEAVALPEPDESQIAADTHRMLHAALDSIRGEFEEHNWQAFWRTAVEQQSAADVARDLGLTSAAVRQAKFRVLRRLRRELEELDDA